MTSDEVFAITAIIVLLIVAISIWSK